MIVRLNLYRKISKVQLFCLRMQSISVSLSHCRSLAQIISSQRECAQKPKMPKSSVANTPDNALTNVLPDPPRSTTIRIFLNARALRAENAGVSLPKRSIAPAFRPHKKSRSRKSSGSGFALYQLKCILHLYGVVCETCSTEDGAMRPFSLPSR